GPAIGPCCYAVGNDTACQLGYPEPAGAFRRIDGVIHADLALLNAGQLAACGIPGDAIEHLDACTACHPERYFSHRRDHGRTGRHLAVAAWPSSP
ncbi:MAG TPA: laccase domain-containing protein, partial [Mariprofundaceae bacterium]|nr:laccase domain-containing protein [Mariprofundaceae bacterium]